MKRVLAFVLSILVIGITFISCTMLNSASEEEIIAEAELNAKKKFYDEWGIVADEMSSEIIYSNDEQSLVAVRCQSDDYVGDEEWASSICISISNSNAMWLGQTILMPGDYDFNEHLDELKSTLKVE